MHGLALLDCYGCIAGGAATVGYWARGSSGFLTLLVGSKVAATGITEKRPGPGQAEARRCDAVAWNRIWCGVAWHRAAAVWAEEDDRGVNTKNYRVSDAKF